MTACRLLFFRFGDPQVVLSRSSTSCLSETLSAGQSLLVAQVHCRDDTHNKDVLFKGVAVDAPSITVPAPHTFFRERTRARFLVGRSSPSPSYRMAGHDHHGVVFNRVSTMVAMGSGRVCSDCSCHRLLRLSFLYWSSAHYLLFPTTTGSLLLVVASTRYDEERRRINRTWHTSARPREEQVV